MSLVTVTEHGFEWGPLRVSRMLHAEGRGYAVGVDTDHVRLQLWVSEGGRRVRVFDGDKEMVTEGGNP